MFINKTDNKSKLTPKKYGDMLSAGTIDADEWEKETQDFTTNLATWRFVEGWSLREVAERLEEFGIKYSWQYIQKIEKGEKKPSYDFMMAFRIVFDVSIDEVFFDPDAYKYRD